MFYLSIIKVFIIIGFILSEVLAFVTTIINPNPSYTPFDKRISAFIFVSFFAMFLYAGIWLLMEWLHTNHFVWFIILSIFPLGLPYGNIKQIQEEWNKKHNE